MGVVVLGLLAGRASAQVTPAAGQTPPDDTPSIRVGATIYADYTYTQEPESTDADGNPIHLSQFNIGRSYINVTGNLSHIVAFRITPDIVRTGSDAGATLNGNLVFRIKYAFAQFNLDDWMPRGSWARLGIQQTPWLDFEEGIYRYRFQGTVFSERETAPNGSALLVSSDAGASFHYTVPSNYGDIHVGIYNGENYNRAEVNDQKAIQIRGSVRPFATQTPILRGLRAHAFYDADSYIREGERTRFLIGVTFEHAYVNAGFDFLDAHDQTSGKPGTPEIKGKGYSIWATPKSTIGWEALLRYDHYKPDTTFASQTRNRTIVGVAYWFPHQGNVSSALMFDYDGQSFDNFTPAPPAQKRLAVHALVNF
jgi:hypothetical protein